MCCAMRGQHMEGNGGDRIRWVSYPWCKATDSGSTEIGPRVCSNWRTRPHVTADIMCGYVRVLRLQFAVRSPFPNFRPPTGTIWVHIHSAEFSRKCPHPCQPTEKKKKTTHIRTQFSASQWAKLATASLRKSLTSASEPWAHTLWVAGQCGGIGGFLAR